MRYASRLRDTRREQLAPIARPHKQKPKHICEAIGCCKPKERDARNIARKYCAMHHKRLTRNGSLYARGAHRPIPKTKGYRRNPYGYDNCGRGEDSKAWIAQLISIVDDPEVSVETPCAERELLDEFPIPRRRNG